MSKETKIISLFTTLVIVVGIMALVIISSDFFPTKNLEEVSVEEITLSSGNTIQQIPVSGKTTNPENIELIHKLNYQVPHKIDENSVFVTSNGQMYHMPESGFVKYGEGIIVVEQGYAMIWRKD